MALQEVDKLLAKYEASEAMRAYASHNHEFWRLTHGGRSVAESPRFDFDPREHYWKRGEYRLLVSFFVDRLREAYVPAKDLRSLAFRVFRHFDEARVAGRLGDPKIIRAEGTGPAEWPGFLDVVRPVAKDLPEMPEYARLREIWGRQLKNASIRDELLQYFDEAAKWPRLGEVEQSFYLRIAWFPYLGLESLDQLFARQRFFAGYYLSLTSTNSYEMGGGISFAPIVQNNPASLLLDFLQRWRTETPHDTKFIVEGKTEKKDRSDHAPVIELFCNLNLHRAPILNSRTAGMLSSFARPNDASVYDQILRAGNAARSMLVERPAVLGELASRFMKLLEHSSAPVLPMEGIRRKPLAAKRPADVAAQNDPKVQAAIDEAARKTAAELTELDRATAMYHLLSDASIYEEQQQGHDTITPDYAVADVVSGGMVTSARENADGPRLALPTTLERIANDALGYLHAGSHVLLAGPPGTGKTTVAQFVGHAWKRSLTGVALEIPFADAPITTVATSAWSPFHTTGGMFPTADNRLEPTRGIFIDPKSDTKNEWRLRGECVVLDEMNRADLDRCIGELYPLLSGSVPRVHPAGIPGVDWITGHDRFRIVATVNDASLDDVVFPISEGLARRFVRLELHGATLESLKGLMVKGKPDAARQAAAMSVIEQLFDVCKAEKLLVRTEEDGDHLPFGVGYFGIVQRWVIGELRLSKQFQEEDLEDQATAILRTSLASVVRVRGLSAILSKLATEAE